MLLSPSLDLSAAYPQDLRPSRADTELKVFCLKREKQISHINTYIGKLKKNGTDETICRAATETQTGRTDFCTQLGKEKEG